MTFAHGAVMATSPASAPFTLMERSALPNMARDVMLEATTPAEAARFVVTAMRAMAPASAAMVLPGLNPNHPSHKMNPPSVTSGMLWPGIGCMRPSDVYFPSRGPRTMIPASPRPASNRVDHGRTGEIEKTHSSQPAATPNPVALDRIDDWRLAGN